MTRHKYELLAWSCGGHGEVRGARADSMLRTLPKMRAPAMASAKRKPPRRSVRLMDKSYAASFALSPGSRMFRPPLSGSGDIPEHSRKQVSDTSRAVALSSGLVADADSAQRGSPLEYQFNLIDGSGERLNADNDLRRLAHA